MKKQKCFGIYRFQLIPLSIQIQQRLDGTYSSYEELIAKKNEILASIYMNENFKIYYQRRKVIKQRVYNEQDGLLIRIGAKREMFIETEEFTRESIESYPNILVFIDNNPDTQIILIEENKDAFGSTNVVRDILNNTFNRFLKDYDLIIYVEPIFEKGEFWELVFKYKEELKGIDFELIKPNITNIRGEFAKDIQRLQDTTNAHRMKINMRAPEKGRLENINPDNNEISDLIDYQSQGGGSPKILIKGIKRKIQIGKIVKTIDIDEVRLNIKNPAQVVEFLKSILRSDEIL